MEKRGADARYLKTLLLYFEEEVMGEAYFLQLLGSGPINPTAAQHEKLVLLAKVESFAADAVRPLIKKYNLTPRPDAELIKIGKGWGAQEKHRGWPGFVADIAERYPAYITQFEKLEQMAPANDLAALRVLTNHEIAAVRFAECDRASSADSTAPLLNYLAGRMP